MYLDEVESKQELLDALAEDDQELIRDIKKAVESAAWEAQSGYNEWDQLDAEQLVRAAMNLYNDGYEFISRRAHASFYELPEDMQNTLFEEWLKTAADNFERGRNNQRTFRGIAISASGPSPFEIDVGRGGGETIAKTHYSYTVIFEEPLSWVPEAEMLEFLDDASYGAEWEVWDGEAGSDSVTYYSGWVEGDDTYNLSVDDYRLGEYIQDARTGYFSNIVEEDPKAAMKLFFGELKKRYPGLAKKLKKAKLPGELLLDYAVLFFDDEEEAIDVIQEAVGDIGYEGTKAPTILEIDRATLQALDIPKGGRWYDGAPWKLLNLPPEELAYEGTRQRHCVGRHSMGYKESVERGKTEIWSLRSAAGKPLLTFEIDKTAWDYAQTARERGSAVEQIKGKLNRVSGETEEETKILYWIFNQLDIDPEIIPDFRPRELRDWDVEESLRQMAEAIPRAQMNPRKKAACSFDQPWVPYAERGRKHKNPRRSRKKAAKPRRRGLSPSLKKLLRGI